MVKDTVLAVILSTYLQNAGDNAALYYGRIEQPLITSAWIGHPYWDDADYHIGDICYDDVLYKSVWLRYNIMSNEVIVLTPERRISVVPDQDKIHYFTIEGKRYERVDDRFMCIEADGGYALLHARAKKRTADDIEDGRIVHKISSTDQYYLRDRTGELTAVSSLKSLYRTCSDYAAELKALKKSERLKFSRKTRKHDLMQCVSLLNLLHPSVDNETEGVTFDVGKQDVIAHFSAYDNLPDSIFESIVVPTSLPVYRAYGTDGNSRFDFVPDDYTNINPGIQNIDPLHETRSLDEVEVVAMKRKATAVFTGMESFRPALLRNVPTVMGENDVLKLALMLPGVTSTGEASSGLNVRGGGADQNLTLYNGNTVFNPMHMFGLFSAFNSDMIAETELFKGGLPSQYGGRLSSVMNIKGRLASKEKMGGSASLGLITSKAMLELPIKKNRASLLIGGRTTYSDWMLKKLPEQSGYSNGKAGFWDLSSTLSCMVGESGNLVVSGYYSQDNFSFTEFDKYSYSNLNASAEYTSQVNDCTNVHLSLGFDHYDYRNDNFEDEYASARLSFSLNQLFLRASASYRINGNHTLKAGLQTQLYLVMPGQYNPIGKNSNVIGRKLDDDKALESALFTEDNWQINDRWSIVAGLRLNVFNSMREGMSASYINPDLRLSATYQIADNQTLKLGFNTQCQYINKVSNTVIMSPTDTWMLSNSEVKPQQGRQASLGYFWQSPSRNYELSAEMYYKGMDNYLTYRSAAQLIMNAHLEQDVVGTQGRAYGLELQLTKPAGKLNGWISYTYSRASLRQPKSDGAILINDGAWFPAEYDSPHIFKLVGNYKFTRRYSMSLNADYSTGHPYTAPVAQYYDHLQQIMVPQYSDRNQCRMPDYCRVDWSLNIEPSHHLTNLTHSWFTFGVYNLLGRKNAYSIYFKYDQKKIQGYKLSIFGAPIPYVSYNIKF